MNNNKNYTCGLISMILGIVAILLSCCVVGIAPAIAALPLGIVALYKKERNTGLAITGIVLSSVAIVVSLIMILQTVSDMYENDSELEKDCQASNTQFGDITETVSESVYDKYRTDIEYEQIARYTGY